MSCLLPVYHGNSEEEVSVAIDSIVQQTFRNLELIVAVDGQLSSEFFKHVLRKCEESVERFNGIRIIQTLENIGLGQLLCKTFPFCNGEFIARFDSDDESLPNRIETQLEVIRKDPLIGLVSSYVSEHRNLNEPAFAIKECGLLLRDVKEIYWLRNPINHPSVIIRSEALKNLPQKVFNIKFHEDYLMWGVILTRGWKYVGLPTILVKMKVDAALHKRRGGVNYIKNGIQSRFLLMRLGLFSFGMFVLGALVTTVFRLIPSELRSFVTTHILRREA